MALKQANKICRVLYNTSLQSELGRKTFASRSFHILGIGPSELNQLLIKPTYNKLNEITKGLPCCATQVRKYSHPNDPECKNVKTASQRKCPKFELCNCDEPENTDCNKSTYVFRDCKKKEAPYPSFSEACAEDPYIKPSECKMCPWKPEDHPTFKPTTKHFHTSTNNFASNKSKKCGPDLKSKVPKLDKQLNTQVQNDYENVNSLFLNQATQNLCTEIFQTVPLSGIESLILKQKESKKDKCNRELEEEECFKFPFKPIQEYSYDRKIVVNIKKKDPCKKTHKKVIIDCPPTDETKRCETTEILNPPVMLFARKNSSDEVKCPKIDRRICEDEKKECPKKIRKSQDCPPDLIGDLKKRYQKKDKKTAPISLPIHENPQKPPEVNL